MTCLYLSLKANLANGAAYTMKREHKEGLLLAVLCVQRDLSVEIYGDGDGVTANTLSIVVEVNNSGPLPQC